jgi:hypothetical protein
MTQLRLLSSTPSDSNQDSSASQSSKKIVTGYTLKHPEKKTREKKELEKTEPHQVALFQHFMPKEEKYSNTIDLYDLMPKYASTETMKALRVNGIYLPVRHLTFKYRLPDEKNYENYKISIAPARIFDNTGKEKEYYPSMREEMIEEALRKIASKKESGSFLDGQAGVSFTLKELWAELKSQGHDYHLDSIKEGLEVCNRCTLIVQDKDDNTMMGSPILPTLLIANRKDWLNNPNDAKCYAQFNIFVTHSVKNITYRQYDYHKFMKLKSGLARWLYKRMAHNYTGANYDSPYNILASTIIDNSHLVNYTRFRNNIAAIDAAIKELIDHKIVLDVKKKDILGLRKKVVDVKYTLLPALDFVHNTTLANARKKHLQNAQLVYLKETNQA